MPVYGKLRACRHCGKKYVVPSKWPGCCSSKCKELRSGQKSEVRILRKDNDIADSQRWYRLRYEVLRNSNGKCNLCGSTKELQVDHIKPRSRYPEITFEISNLQVLCKACNIGKGARYKDDWR